MSPTKKTSIPKGTVLIVEDDSAHRNMLKLMLESWGYATFDVDNGLDAYSFIQDNNNVDLVLCDIRMAIMDGITTLKQIKEWNEALPVILMTAYSSIENAVEAIQLGAYTYLTKPLDFEALKNNLQNAMQHMNLLTENNILKKELLLKENPIIGNSKPMRELYSMIETVAPSEATVLITGESGTGKELVARAIQVKSQRKNGPFVTINCGALSENLLESELFGHEKGSFTGADKTREGRFVHADNGTIFLDEIGEMPQTVQVKLLRVLQNGEIQRVGSDKSFKVNVRVLAATNKDLLKRVQEGEFREDLFYRLNVISITTIPLRERSKDIPLLIKHFIDKFSEINKKNIVGCSPKCMDILMRYDWPGNVRELENAIERAVILSNNQYLSEHVLPLSLQNYSGEENEDIPSNFLANKSLDEIEQEAIIAILALTGDNKSETARRLGITRATLHSKLKKYNI